MEKNEKKTSAAKNGGKKTKSRKTTKIVLLVVELLVVAVLVGALLWINNIEEESEGGFNIAVNFKDAPAEDLNINEPVQENETMEGFRNIALFGVDSRSGQLMKGTLSDCIIIASINQDTGEVKLVSVYRDTYLNLTDGRYDKCNKAYSYGGAEQAIKMLNSNLDLDIREFVTVGFEGLSAAIDALGGVYLDVDEEELLHINSYQKTMAEDMKTTYTEVTQTGYQLLNGLQATAYCRIRYKKGNDFSRAASQREVIQAIIDKARKADLATLNKVVTEVSKYIYTSFSMEDVLGMLGDLPKYSIVEEGGFPKEDMRGSDTLGSKGSCVFAVDLEDNVKWLHEFLFGEVDYQPSGNIVEDSKVIHDFVSQYVDID